ncbi:MAG: SulP family inorganic anion transporter [Chitinophagales bacterium]
MQSISTIFKHVKRDALAGIVTGIMAVPLTVGICLMSEYPIMTGLYTVIFAGIISFITYLFKPGNYTGMPGVAAGLAPVLALGVHTFGMENMPFVIFLTATFQMLVWKFKLERFILRVVPHYLVEGLLAGVGLKIALKFVPFLYDIEHETDTWLNFEREIVIGLSVVSFIAFVWLYKAYKKNMPALPYVVITATAIIIGFFFPLPKITIDNVPFQLALPLPHFGDMSGGEMYFMLLKMVGYAMMLGVIDVIEQVMSNVAIEKMDPLDRKCDSNNSLLAIWIGNMGATFFGGMTNLDGLAKSTTNTVAGAVTKLSNLFTSLVLLIFVLFPFLLGYLPEYALGIIMVYSGWKMIANIAHVRAEGRYALIMAGICGLLVWKLGIFEGLLLLLVAHAIIQFIFMKRLGKSNAEVWSQFKSTFQEQPKHSAIEQADIMSEPSVPILDKFQLAINNHNLDLLMKLYADEAILVPSFSTKLKMGSQQIRQFYKDFFEKDDVQITVYQVNTQKVNNLKVDTGTYSMKWKNRGFETEKHIRFSLVIKNGKIVTDHSSVEPEFGSSIDKLPKAYQGDFS